LEDEGSGQGTRSDDLQSDDVQAQADEVQAWKEVLTGRRATTVGDEDGDVASGWLWVAVIAAALAANYAVFRYFGGSYFHWYVSNGSKLALALALFSLAIKLDDEPGLIVAHPTNYVAAWFAFFGQGFFWLQNILASESSESGSIPFWDGLVTILFSLAWTAAVFAWLAVVVPAQYCVTLVCGAPVRLTLATRDDVIVERLERKKPRPGRTWIPTSAKRVNVGLNVREKPVTATAAISAAALFALSFAV
jgi:hypothetical protein